MLVPRSVCGLSIVGVDRRSRRTCVDLSAFIIIVWCTYRSRRRGTLRFSGLIRKIVTEATFYFLVMVAAQIYSIVGVRSFAFFPRLSVIVNCGRYRMMGNDLHFCECVGSSEGDSAALTEPPSPEHEVRMGCTSLRSPPAPGRIPKR